MSLRLKIAIAIVIILILQGAMDFVNQHYTVLPRFARLERIEAVKNLKRCEEAIWQQIEKVDVLAYDWAPWDDTYEFVIDQNEDYKESNLVESLFTTGILDLLYICDTEGKVIWGEVFDPHTNEQIQLSEFPGDQLPANNPLTNLTEIDSSVKGIMLIGNRILMIASRPIVTSDEEGPIRGAMIMGQFLTQETIDQFMEQVKIDLTVMPISADSLSPSDKRSIAHISESEPYFLDKSNQDLLQGFTTFPDIYGTPQLIIRASIPRNILFEGHQAIRHSMVSLIMVGLVSLLTVMLLIDRWVLIRLKTLSGLFSELGNDHDLSARTTVVGSDEIGLLGKVVNTMLARLQIADLELHASEERYRYLVDAMGEGIVTVDMHDHALFSFANPAAEQLFGVGPGELVGRRLQGFCDEMEQKKIDALLENQKATRIYTYEMELTRDDNSKRLVQVTTSPRSSSGNKLLGSFSLFVDITELKSAEEELRSSASKTAQLDGIRKTVATLAHEINNPLTGVIGNLQYLDEEENDLNTSPEIVKETLIAALRIRDVVKSLSELQDPVFRPYIGEKEIIDIRQNHNPDLF